LGGKLHLKLNICGKPIANKYREGKPIALLLLYSKTLSSMISLTFLFTTVVLIVLVLHSEAFGVSRITTTQKSTILHGIFGGLSKAFENDENLGKAENAGLTKGPVNNDQVQINGKPVKAIVGQKVSVVANAARVKINYDCRNGDCGTCMIKMNGKKVKACQMTIPKGACYIETL